MDYPGKVITKTQVTPTQISASGNWTVDDAVAAVKNNNWPIAGVPNPISKSLRFNSADTAYLNRTPASATNQKTWTWSGWVKRGTLGVSNRIFAADDGSGSTDQDYNTLFFTSSDQIKFAGNLTDFRTTTPVYRDPSAWYHIVFVTDTTQATAANRFRLYVNGVEVTAFGTSNNPSQNTDLAVNANIGHYLGAVATGPSGSYLNGYMTEINFIDGQALTPSSFGMTNPQTGQWIPLKYSGTYGTNGFYLNFKDATSTTTLGYDYSGNANNWTTNNFSVTAGAGNDSLTDVPTPWFAYNTTGDVGGVIRGNYCTLNPLKNPGGNGAILNGNLNVSTLSGDGYYSATISISSGKWYAEITPTYLGTTGLVGVVNANKVAPTSYPNLTAFGWVYQSNGNKANNNSTVSYGASWSANDVIGIALDMDAGTVTFYKNGVSQGQAYSGITGDITFCCYDGSSTNYADFTCNFGQRPFAYTPPAGFRSLCTTNLPPPTIGFGLTNQGDDYFNALTYTGNGTDGRTVTGVGFNPDLVWVKGRSNAGANVLADSVRGSDKNLYSNLTDAETNPITGASGGGIGTVTTDGFVLEQGTVNMDLVNTNTRTYVAWNWKANGTGVSNTAGSTASTVSANTTAGFSIVTYTGTGANATVGHGCQVGGVATAPSMIIIKGRSTTVSWPVWHTFFGAAGNSDYLLLNTTDQKGYAGGSPNAQNLWNSITPTASVFSLGTYAYTNANTTTYVAYCFAAVPGYSAFGSYTGNGSATDGPFVYTGFAPKFFMFKRTDTATGTLANSWAIKTAIIPGYNQNSSFLAAASSNQEDTGFGVDFLANGVKLKLNAVDGNASGGTYIYACFAEYPFQFANAR